MTTSHWHGAMSVPGAVDAEGCCADQPTRQACDCQPCPGRGNDGHGLTHCAECCFGSGVEADIDCPIHGEEPQGGCDCTELCGMGPTCPGGSLAGLPGSGCWRTKPTDASIAAGLRATVDAAAADRLAAGLRGERG